MKINWNYPTTVWFGEGRIKDLHIACRTLKIKKPLFVTDQDLAKIDLVKNIINDPNLKNFLLNIFSNIKGNPVGSNVEEGVKVFKNGNHDGVIAFGGGSGLDVGKAIAFMSVQNRPIWDFEDVGDNWTKANNEVPPIIAVPTTAGTGSEAGRASLITNEKTNTKKIIFHPKFLPSIVILDPCLTINLPPKITAATGMDALAHNLEAYCASGYHPMADGIALEGMNLIKKWLLIAFKEGNNLKARSNMLVAATMGSTAFQKGLGAIHSLSHPVNSIHNIHHGLSNAIFMPYVLTFNKKEIEEKIIKLSGYLELKEKSFNCFLEWILDLRKKLEIPHKLSDVADIKPGEIDKLSLMALEDPSTPGNPKKLTLEDMKLLYQYSIEGKMF